MTNQDLAQSFSAFSIHSLYIKDVVGAGETELIPLNKDGVEIEISEDDFDTFWDTTQQGVFDLVGELHPSYKAVKGLITQQNDGNFVLETKMLEVAWLQTTL